jgi:hypothetical protein
MARRARRPGLPDNLEEMMERLGNVPLHRIRMHPPPVRQRKPTFWLPSASRGSD